MTATPRRSAPPPNHAGPLSSAHIVSSRPRGESTPISAGELRRELASNTADASARNPEQTATDHGATTPAEQHHHERASNTTHASTHTPIHNRANEPTPTSPQHHRHEPASTTTHASTHNPTHNRANQPTPTPPQHRHEPASTTAHASTHNPTHNGANEPTPTSPQHRHEPVSNTSRPATHTPIQPTTNQAATTSGGSSWRETVDESAHVPQPHPERDLRSSRGRRGRHLGIALLSAALVTLAACGSSSSVAGPDPSPSVAVADTAPANGDTVPVDANAAAEEADPAPGDADALDPDSLDPDSADNGALDTGDAGVTINETITLVAYDSFALPKELLTDFTKRTGIEVKVLAAGDAGEMVNKAILTKDAPIGDVLWGVDNTWLGAATDADLFEPYVPASAKDLRADLRALEPDNRVTPVDYGDVCVNADKSAFGAALPMPTSFDDLADPRYRSKLVVQNPATSSPGLAFLLATIAHFGTDGDNDWTSYWERLRKNDVKVVNGWGEAYETWFSGSGGDGTYPLVVSYGSSPPAAVLFGPDPAATEAPTAVLESTCFRQVEFAGILKGTDSPDAARALLDELTAPPVQAALPLNLFVYPANTTVELPDLFRRFAAAPVAPLTLPPDEIATSRARWIDDWSEIML
jgi:thiamine transport system substrate-binding protein